MKKSITSMMCFIVLLSSIAMKLNAQLAGTYSINSAVATGGSNFQSFTAFAASINTAGVSGPVTVVVVPGSGPYVEQVIFTQITGASLTNSIAINGNSCTITFNATLLGAPHTFALNGTDFMTVNDLNMIGTGASYALVCHLWNQANNNRFNNCTFTTPANGTATGHVPVSLSGSGTSATTSGNCGNDNVWNNCTMNNGYYNTIFYGNTTTPYNTGNMVIGCNIRDFYLYGFYNYYCRNTTVRGNTVERPARTNSSTGYGIYFTTGSVANEVIEKNRVQKMFDGTQGTTNLAYCIYLSAAATAGSENIIRNNVVSNINFNNGTLYGIYGSGNSYCNVYHNTVCFDETGSTATGSTYGIYSSAGAGTNVKNNLVYITRGGTGTKYGVMYTNTSIASNNNNIYVNSAAGINATGYYLTNYNSLASWKGVNNGLWDQASMSVDPVFTNPAAFNYLPASVAMNNLGQQGLGVADDILGVSRYTVSPDAGAYEYYNTNCSNTPGLNAILAPTIVACPASISNLAMVNNYTVNGITYQWAAASNSVGPFTPIPNATLTSFATPTLASSTWYSVILGCPNGGGTIAATPGQVMIATTVTNSVPYFEDFEGIYGPNKLPNCSWAASNLGITCQTYDAPNNQNRIPYSGNKFASFYYTPAGTNYIYTNGIQLYAGVTYSASVWFTTEYYTYNTYDLSIMAGPNQSTTGLVPVANLPVAASPSYKQLSNTFTVAASGIYYIAVKAISNGVCCGNYLSWDDLSITIPCELNTPQLLVSGTASSSVCAGQAVNFNATGADTYAWSNGVNTASLSDVPALNMSYTVVGTSSLTGCSASVVKNIAVNPSPQVGVFVFDPDVCEGLPASLNAIGAGSYTWNTGSSGALLVAVPATTGSITYTVIGANQYGCTGMATQQINVNALPNVTATDAPAVSCAGDAILLTGSGAASYQWLSNSLYVPGTQIIATPWVSTTYSVTGTDANGCSKTISIAHAVDICTGIAKTAAGSGSSHVYPNPNSGMFNIELSNGLTKTIEIIDMTGRTIVSATSDANIVPVDIQDLASGIYYVKVKSDNSAEMLKIIKQ